MGTIRAVLKLIGFFGGTFIFYAMIMISTFLSIFGLNYQKWRGYFLNKWGIYSCKVIGMRITVEGQAPDPPFFLVSNHLSYTDIFLLFSQVKGLFVAKSDVKSWPVIGPVIKSCGILFIDRERRRDINRVNDLIRQNVTEEQGIIVFPESTTSAGQEILPFRSSLLEYPAAEKMPVSYATIRYSSNNEAYNASEAICWWSDISFFAHFLNLLKMKQFSAYVTFGKEKIILDERKKLAKSLEHHVRSDFIPVTDTK